MSTHPEHTPADSYLVRNMDPEEIAQLDLTKFRVGNTAYHIDGTVENSDRRPVFKLHTSRYATTNVPSQKQTS